MTTRPVFSREYYNSPALFTRGWHFDSKKKIKFTSGLIEDCFGDRIRAALDKQGTISLVPSTFFERCKHFFSLTQDKNLIDAHHRLKNLELKIQDPLCIESREFQAEIHDKGAEGASHFSFLLSQLNRKFQAANTKNVLTTTLVKILNVIRRFFHCRPIQFYSHVPLDLDLFQRMAIDPALQLTAKDQLKCTYRSIVTNHSSLPLPPQLNGGNLQRLELGLSHAIKFTMDGKKFTMTFDHRLHKFLLSYWGTEGELESYPPRSQPLQTHTVQFGHLDIVEKKLDGSRNSHHLQPSREYRPIDYLGDWFPANKPQTVEMNMNSEYTIPLSQGHLCLKLCRRF